MRNIPFPLRLRRRALRSGLAGLLFLAGCPAMIAAAPPSAGPADAVLPALLELYKDLHANPELSMKETRSAARMAAELRSAGCETSEGVGGTGVVGVLRNGNGRTILIRGDMDALPVLEETGLSYASKVRAAGPGGRETPVMHACGHDVHMTCLAGTARLLSASKDRWRGTVVFIAQPGEETGAGAKAMLEDGLYERFPRPDAALALHVDSSLESGKAGWTAGPSLASVDSVNISVRGVGGHGAYPEGAKDPIVLAAQIVLALQTIVSREVRAIDAAVVTVGSIHGGTKHNIIPDEVKLELTVRTYDDAVRQGVLDSIRRICKGLAEAAGVPEGREPVVDVREEEYTPATINDPALTRRVTALLERTLGPENVVEREPMMGGEDFGRYGRTDPRVPICMFRIGSVAPARIEESRRPGGRPLPSVHSGLYHPDAAATLRTGVIAMTEAAIGLLAEEPEAAVAP